MPRASESFGDSTTLTFASVENELSRLSISDWALADSQLWMPMVVHWSLDAGALPDGTVSTPDSTYGSSRSHAPEKKNLALLSSGDPAKGSKLNGPASVSRPSVSMMYWPWSWPTL